MAHQMLTLVSEGKNQELELMLTKIPEECLGSPEVQACLKYFWSQVD